MPFSIKINEDDRSARISRKDKAITAKRGSSEGETIMISGCQDNQTSADIAAGTLGTKKPAGAMTQAFKNSITKDVSCHRLLQNMRKFLKKNGYTQIPQMHSEKFIKLDQPFATYSKNK